MRLSFRLLGSRGLGLGKDVLSFDRNMVFSALGLGCYLAWSFLFWSDSLSLGGELPRGITGQGTVIQSSFSVVAALLLVCSAPRLVSLRQHAALLGIFAVVASGAVVTVFTLDIGTTPPLWRMLGLGLCGLGGVIRLAYNEHLSLQGVQRMAMCTGGAYLVGFVLHAVTSILPLSMGLVVALLLPFIACGLLLAAARPAVLQEMAAGVVKQVRKPQGGEMSDAASSCDSLVPRVTLSELLRSVSWKLIAALILTYFSYGVASAFHGSGGALLTEVAPLARTGVYAGASFAAIFFGYLLYRKNVMIAFYIAFPLMAIVSLIPPSFDPFSIGPVLCVALIADVLWFLFIDTVIKDSRSALACVALMYIAQFGGGGLGQIVYSMVPTPEVASSVILVSLLGALLVIMSFVTQSKPVRIFGRESEDNSLLVEGSSSSHVLDGRDNGSTFSGLNNHVSLISQTYGLTAREQEVLSIWATGRSADHIAKMLSISKSTVKTHLNHIYTKTGATSREALFELLDQIAPTQ